MSASFDNAPLTNLYSVPTTRTDTLTSASSAEQCSSFSTFIAFVMYSMLTYGIDSFSCIMPNSSYTSRSIDTHFPRTMASAAIDSNLFALFLSFWKVHATSNVTPCIPRLIHPMLLRFAGLVVTTCFAFLRLQKAVLFHITGVLFVFFRVSLLSRVGRVGTCAQAHCNHGSERHTKSTAPALGIHCPP